MCFGHSSLSYNLICVITHVWKLKRFNLRKKAKQAHVTWSSNVEVVRGVGMSVVRVGMFYVRLVLRRMSNSVQKDGVVII